MSLLEQAPVLTLRGRVARELAYALVPGKPMRFSRAPGRLDVMGGIADYTGALVCEMPLDRSAAVALQERDDRQVQVFSFNLFDEHRPFTLSISLDDLAQASIDALRKNFDEPGRKWGGYLIGCLAILHESKLIDLADPQMKGMNLALLSTVPLGGGVSSSAAVEVATMSNLIDHFDLRRQLNPKQVAKLCQQVENRVVGAPSGIMDQATSCAGEAGTLMKILCQPCELKGAVTLPAGIHVVGVLSNVQHSVSGGAYRKTRCAAFMGHRIILEQIKRMGDEAGTPMISDPMNGYLANLLPDDYKRFFRGVLPESIRGDAFLAKYGPTVDTATQVDPNEDYHVQDATDHHVLEARRVRDFVTYIGEAAGEPASAGGSSRKLSLDKAGHLMYASHASYTNNAKMGAPECDLLVDLVRANERHGLYGAKITGGGSGGTVAVLCDLSPRSDEAIQFIMAEYTKKTGLKPELFTGTSDGAWKTGTALT